MTKTKLNIIRKNISPYQGEFFCALEKESLERISGLVYESKDQVLDKVLITNTHTKVNDLSNEEFDSTKILIHPNSGYDNFDVDFVKRANFPIIIGNEIRANAVTNYILSCLFSHYSNVPSSLSWDKSRVWNRSLINEKRVLIIGKGMIGNLLESSLKPIAKSVSVFDPYKGYEELNLNVDVVLMACSLTPTSKEIIDSNFLKQLPKDYLLINAARGTLINENDLKESLKENPDSYAYLDVFSNEPCDFSQWKELGNVSCSSHIAGVFKELNQSILDFEYKVLNDFINMQNDIEAFKEKYKDSLLQNRVIDNFLI